MVYKQKIHWVIYLLKKNFKVKILTNDGCEPSIDQLETRPVFTEAGPKGPSQSRTSFKVTFGIIPSYSSNAIGLEIDGARKGGPAEQAGMKKGDIIIEIEGKSISNIYDYMYRLAELKTGQSVEVTIQRGDKELKLIL